MLVGHRSRSRRGAGAASATCTQPALWPEPLRSRHTSVVAAALILTLTAGIAGLSRLLTSGAVGRRENRCMRLGARSASTMARSSPCYRSGGIVRRRISRYTQDLGAVCWSLVLTMGIPSYANSISPLRPQRFSVLEKAKTAVAAQYKPEFMSAERFSAGTCSPNMQNSL
jgi:hypothetical protein